MTMPMRSSRSSWSRPRRAIAPQPQRLSRGADRAGLAAELMNDDFGLLAGSAEAVLNEIHFRFHHCHVVLRSTLQHKTRAQRRQIGNTGYVEEYVLRQDGR